ncbi:MAG TPA: HAD family hydrolase [Conexibacter sp.]|nr:HAD family hydrolase [Conexibacter sp.]
MSVGRGAPRALLLDALGTLVELEPPVEPLRRELRERFGVGVSADEARAALRAEIAFYRSHHDDASDRARLADLRRRAAETLRGALPPGCATLPLPELTGALLAALRFRPFPEVADVLCGARARGARLVVVSNWDVSLHDVLDATGLAPLVDGVVTSAEVGSSKPEREIFARGLALAGAAAEDAVHVGDSVEHDVAGALAAGIVPLLLARDGASPDGSAPAGVRAIATLRPLLELLDGDARRGPVSFVA